MADNLLNPESREEAFLAKAAGENVELPKPASRKEEYLNAIAEGGGGIQTFDFTEIYNIGIDALNESGGGTHVENVDLTEEQFNYALNNLKSSKIAIIKEIHEIDENANEIITMISVFNFIGANDSEWVLNFNMADSAYTFTGSKYTNEDEEIYYSLSVENSIYLLEEGE